MIKYNDNVTLQTHIIRINNAINFIEQNLESDLSLGTLAKITWYSPFHFHRIFTELNRETPHEFVIRKRIERIAWKLLKHKNLPINELAHRYGFDNQASFSKSFKKYYGLSASELRRKSKSEFNKIVQQNSKIGKKETSVEAYFRNVESIKRWMVANANVESKVLPRQFLVSIRSQGSFDLSEIAFEKLKSWAELKGLADQKTMKWLMVIHDNPAITEESKISHSACLKLEKDLAIADEMTLLTIPEGKFLVGTFEIEDNDFKRAWGGMSVWLMDNGFSYRDGFYFEVFHTDSIFQKGAKHKVDICIPIT